MIERKFNLTTDPWIKVIVSDTNQELKVSLIDLFKNAHQYRQLAGEMRVQNLAIMRLLLAILTTVYSRFDAAGQLYDWLIEGTDQFGSDAKFDEDYDEEDIEEDTLTTWHELYQKGQFSDLVIEYLKYYSDWFDFFGKHPFYQATKEEYDSLVPANKSVAKGKGTVAIKQINRRVSESNNSPALFSPKAGEYKNEMPIDELVRWVITYQNYTGVTDKTKITASEKFSVSPGWLYKLNPVLISGKSIFETLMLNLVLYNQGEQKIALERPVWEFASAKAYISERQTGNLPDNLAELYTSWARVLHLEWNEDGQATIFSAGLPKIESTNAFTEPMTVWRYDKKTDEYRPAVRNLQSLHKAMWRNFSNYVNVQLVNDTQEPGVIKWLRLLKENQLITRNRLLTLVSIDLIDDGNATSQSPTAELYDDMSIDIGVLFDTNNVYYWPARIEQVIDLTQKIGQDFWIFARNLGKMRGFQKDGLTGFANQLSAQFYYGLNEPFKNWLASLTDEDERDSKIIAWQNQLRNYAFNAGQKVVDTSSSRDIKGIITEHGLQNIFILMDQFKFNVNLDLKKGR
ncbi:type I-E CRISPR-associated protein Cse1/CasA [Lactobacillus sp. ESL0236]|uniref:type I-E CRISPR-associated protein Cse1/CasA n=1 Tax=unclassified Lactobacillus TaxID=2620435 RepID=UPI000EFB370A|nr:MULTISPECIES: type I-E CRISPR-associated protein Cse1/CasA [unclassified Lactobacillus]RMC41963.1 type I-E CRISPR-associated protein Cse1/CasA [Lactobacillus sp. ESL0237]RMC45570.1 type I-E CRISPR-associated protein Cse1/CasA [Lactobacillus sp. ESL0234]RMC46956.1 type I-E CRISPR-associated protein Cse1/CasA [Lactobacillus sp. ESL0236]